MKLTVATLALCNALAPAPQRPPQTRRALLAKSGIAALSLAGPLVALPEAANAGRLQDMAAAREAKKSGGKKAAAAPKARRPRQKSSVMKTPSPARWRQVYRTSQPKSTQAPKGDSKKPAPTPAAPVPEEPAGPRDLDEAITELRKTEPPRENVPAPSKPPAPQQTQEFPWKRQLENPQDGFITRTPKAPKPDLGGALTEAGRQVQKRNADAPRKSGEELGFIRRVKK